MEQQSYKLKELTSNQTGGTLHNNEYILEYIWVGGEGELRSKTKVYTTHKKIKCCEDIPVWNFDGSSTKQRTGSGKDRDTEVVVKPCKMVKDPFRCDNSYLILCDTYYPKGITSPEGEPIPSNYRPDAVKKFKNSHSRKDEPWFGLEQEYFMIHSDWEQPMHGLQEQYYCGVGHKKINERVIAEEHLSACLYAGLTISGINAEVSSHQWEFQIGPVEGIDASDQFYLARYILERVAEKYGVCILYDPKPYPWLNGTGCHTNFSTKPMRTCPTGFKVIKEAIENLGKKHVEYMKESDDLYGINNYQRLIGIHETSSMDVFSWGVGTRHTSIRVPNQTAIDGCGYFEDRRPAGNINPYRVTSAIYDACCNCDTTKNNKHKKKVIHDEK